MHAAAAAPQGPSKIKLPLQLASLIHGEADKLLLLDEDDHGEDREDQGSHDQEEDEDDQQQAARKRKKASGESSSARKTTSAAGGKDKRSLNAVISATKNRHIKELGSYVRSVCMRMGFGECNNFQQGN